MNKCTARLDKKLFRSERTIISVTCLIAKASDYICLYCHKMNLIKREENAVGKTRETKRIVSVKLVIGSLLSLALILDVALLGSVFARSKKPSVLSINDVKADPYAYKGTITITGVVAEKSRLERYRKDPKIFFMVDTSEAKLCKQTGCAYFDLPVR